jgi:DNA-binding SARP family transcriptional activator/tetratricopeptide (TPR) repeat protein
VDRVNVQLAGPFAVGRPSARATDTTLGSRKARRLLALLAALRGRAVPIDLIVETLWPDGPPHRPVAGVATLVSRIRSALGPDVILTGQNGYQLGRPPMVRVDLDEAARFVGESERRLPEDAVLAAAAAGRALGLLGSGPALGGEPDVAWVRDVRSEHTVLLRAARYAAARAALGAGDPAAARMLLEAAVRADRLDETAQRLLMVAHQAAGEPARALAVYDRLRTELAEELGVDPAPETREVFAAILAEIEATVNAYPGTAAPRVRARGEPVGRDAELAALTAAWSAACARHPVLLLLAGEGGIGKTWLAEELLATVEATGGQVLRARCYGGERSLFLQPIVDALTAPLTALPAARLHELAGTRADSLSGLIPDLVDVLGPPPAGHANPDVELRRVYEAVAIVLRGLTAAHPILLFLDDLHNTGMATVELLHYLARHAAQSRLMVLATVRLEEGEQALATLAELATRIDIGPLEAEAVTRLAADAGHGMLADTIYRRTRGHPLFVVEALRALASGAVHVSESLRTIVLARLHRAGPETEQLLRAGAVLGAVVDPTVVGAMLELPPHIAAHHCEQAALARLLAVAGRSYEFVNDLVAEVVYESTPLPVRIALHRRAADLLTHTPEAVATHASASGDWPRAARAFLLAGEQAISRWVAADAEGLFDRALKSAERAEDAELIARALLARGRARQELGAYGDALSDHQSALDIARQAGDRRLEMLALRQLGAHSAISIGTPISESTDRLRAGLRIANSLGDRGMQADLLGWLAVLATNRLRFVEAGQLAREAVRAGRAARSDQALALGLDGLKNVQAYLGEIAPLAETLDELEPLLRRLRDLYRLEWAVFESSFPAIAAADWKDAERRIGEAIEVNRRRSDHTYEAWFVAHLGWLSRLQGRLDQALEQGRRAVEATTPDHHRWTRPTCAAFLGTTLIELGDTTEATQLLSTAVAHAKRDGTEAYVLRTLAPLAEATGSSELLAEADTLLASILAPPESAWLLGTDAYLSIARAWVSHGQPMRAQAALAPLLVAARRLNWIPALAQAGLIDALAAQALGDPSADTSLSAVGGLAIAHDMPSVARAAGQALRPSS